MVNTMNEDEPNQIITHKYHERVATALGITTDDIRDALKENVMSYSGMYKDGFDLTSIIDGMDIKDAKSFIIGMQFGTASITLEGLARLRQLVEKKVHDD